MTPPDVMAIVAGLALAWAIYVTHLALKWRDVALRATALAEEAERAYARLRFERGVEIRILPQGDQERGEA